MGGRGGVEDLWSDTKNWKDWSCRQTDRHTGSKKDRQSQRETETEQ